VPILCLLLLGPCLASGDTIVLKNGRRIIASAVTEEGDRVSYETPAGRLSLPRSIVARIERNDLAPTTAGGDSSSAVAMTITPPQVDSSEDYSRVARAAVHDGSIDFAYLARVENDSRLGNAPAATKVAAAHHAAAQFLVSRGNVDGAIDHYRRALIYAPDQLGLLLNLAVLYLHQSQFTAAMDPLERARRVAPDSPDVAKLMGWAYSGANHLDKAVEEWKRAQRLRPDPEVERALAKAERDRDEEASYREGETAHFTLKYNGSATPELARGILRTLEEHYRDLESALDYSPPEAIGVILYTGQSFADITRAPGWVGALNDGRIRIPVQGLSSVTPDLSRVLKHELTHSFVSQKTRGHCPVWLQEGIAQWMEGRRSSDAAAALVTAYEKKNYMPLASLEGSWMSLPSDAAAYAYAWSLAAVESIVQAGGMGDVERLLDRLAGDSSTEAALHDALRDDYSDLEQQTIAYLRRAYLP
jgi:tetratricopeptide (TPR) repeat protein